MKQNIITALDIGSSNIRCIIAKIKTPEHIEVLGISQNPSEGIEKGIVKDIQAVAEAVKKTIKEAENAASTKAINIFTNVTGEHIRTD
jgi:cell division protein FtsA